MKKLIDLYIKTYRDYHKFMCSFIQADSKTQSDLMVQKSEFLGLLESYSTEIENYYAENLDPTLKSYVNAGFINSCNRLSYLKNSTSIRYGLAMVSLQSMATVLDVSVNVLAYLYDNEGFDLDKINTRLGRETVHYMNYAFDKIEVGNHFNINWNKVDELASDFIFHAKLIETYTNRDGYANSLLNRKVFSNGRVTEPSGSSRTLFEKMVKATTDKLKRGFGKTTFVSEQTKLLAEQTKSLKHLSAAGANSKLKRAKPIY